MDALRIKGGVPLSGTIDVSGSKNASLPIMAAALLASGESQLDGTPDLVDIRTLAKVLAHMGVGVSFEEGSLKLDATKIDKPEAPYELVRTMRASILVLGPLVARYGHARVSLPGGCAIGARPIDQHLKGLKKLGVEITLEHGYVEAKADGLVGSDFIFDMPTVGGTEHLMLAASLAQGTTVLRNAAREPEITDLADVLNKMGAQVDGAGTEKITIVGSSSLKPYTHRVIPDRIEYGTFLVAGAMMGQDLTIRGGLPDHQTALIDKLVQTGTEIAADNQSTEITLNRPSHITPVNIKTAPYPGFPTDMQAQMMTLLCGAHGTSTVSETIFENRFMHVAELGRLGANIRVDGGNATINGVRQLSGTTVMATDLRASASLILAGLVADGETIIRRIYHLDRGYEHIEDKLRAVGANITRFSE